MSDEMIKEAPALRDEELVRTQCMKQIADLMRKHFPPLRIRMLDGDRAIESAVEGDVRRGVCGVRGRLLDEGVIVIHVECARTRRDLRVSAGAFFTHLAEIGDKCRPVNSPDPAQDGATSLWIEMRVAAAPMSFSRETAFVAQLEQLDKMAQAIQEEIPRVQDDKDLAKIYDRFSEFLEPVLPWQRPLADLPAAVGDWTLQTLDFLQGGTCVAVESLHQVQTQFTLSLLARAAADVGRSLGALTPPAVATKGLVEIAGKAPGILAIPAIRISLATNPYEMASEVHSMLTTLWNAGTPVVFTGPHAQLQTVFSGGQGGANDPLLPVLRHAPDFDIETLALFAVRAAGRRSGGLSPSAEKEILQITLDSLKEFHESTRKRVLQTVVRRAVASSARGKSAAALIRKYAACVASSNETLSGLAPRPRSVRGAEVQDLFTTVLTDPGLLAYFKDSLLAQDAALEQLVDRLRTEALTRPRFQPLRYSAQGTPGTGKSESAILLARRLNVPFINIDAASLPDFYTASAQLLGSGRGIVGSHQQGRLEQVSKCPRGAVVEVSDLDHATPSVRAALADLFLQLLETGEGQSSTGALFSCASLILAFTMNLPDGTDESVRKRIGFRNSLSRRQVTADVSEHIKRMLSSAFLSRVGTPVIFDPLDGEALAQILERAVKEAVLCAADRLNIVVAGVVLQEGLGGRALDLMESRLVSSGARALLEHGRTLASNAFLQLLKETPGFAHRALRVSFDDKGNMLIKPQ